MQDRTLPRNLIQCNEAMTFWYRFLIVRLVTWPHFTANIKVWCMVFGHLFVKHEKEKLWRLLETRAACQFFSQHSFQIFLVSVTRLSFLNACSLYFIFHGPMRFSFIACAIRPLYYFFSSWAIINYFTINCTIIYEKHMQQFYEILWHEQHSKNGCIQTVLSLCILLMMWWRITYLIKLWNACTCVHLLMTWKAYFTVENSY